MYRGIALTPNERGAQIYHTVVNALGLTLLIYYIPRIDLSAWQQVGVFAVLAFITRLMPASLPGGIFSVSFLMDLVLLELYGTPVAVFVAALITIFPGLLQKWGESRVTGLFFRETAQKIIAVSLAGFAHALYPQSTFLSFVASFFIYFIAEIFMMALNATVEGNDTLPENLISLLQMLSLNYIVLSPLAFFMTVIYRNVHGEMKLLSILLFYLPIMLVSHSFRLYTNINRSYLNTIKTMVNAIEAKDTFTGGHSERVAEYAVAMARELNYARKDVKNLYFLALLHDCGKIGINEEILNKTEPLTTEETEHIREHVIIGARIIEKINFLHHRADVVLHHHEKYDGTGHPSGLKGTEIPTEARLLAVVDAYDAMMHDRPYRGAGTQREVLAEMTRLAGKQFDPALVELLKIILRKRGELQDVV